MTRRSPAVAAGPVARLLAIVAAVLIAWPLSASATENPDVAIDALLRAIHEVPDKAAFERVTPDARQRLEALARNDKLFPAQRYRALEAIGHWPDAQTFELYATVLDAPPTPRGARHRLLRLLSHHYGAEARPILARYLEHADRELRKTAAAALADRLDRPARELLQAAVKRETDDGVRRYVESLLAAHPLREGPLR